MIRELAEKSRSYRGYDSKRRITGEELLSWIDCARLAPSSVNRQPLMYVPVYEPEDCKKLLPLTGWARSLPQLHLPHPGKEPPAYVIICQNTDWESDLKRYLRDIGAAAQTMLLAAAEQDLGGIMIGNFRADAVAEAMKLPSRLVPMLIVAFGKPDETVVLHEALPGEDLRYYRDENDVHYVPKRRLEDIVYQLKQYEPHRYSFYGWEQTDIPATGERYPGIATPRDLYDALKKLWSRETCAPRMRALWSPENPTCGQCSITAFLAQDIFGGEVRGVPLPDGNVHCYNVVGIHVFDLTCEQFGDRVLNYKDNPVQIREKHFQKEEKRLRYEALKRALENLTKSTREETR